MKLSDPSARARPEQPFCRGLSGAHASENFPIRIVSRGEIQTLKNCAARICYNSLESFVRRPVMRRTTYRIVSIVLIASMLASCASTKVPPIRAGGQAFKLAADERQLWQKAEQEAEKLE